jgi:hypothetical protein
VLGRQLSAGTWWVLGAYTAAIDVTAPAARDAVTSPIALAGRSTAFEATVDVEVRQDGTDAALGRGWVMGGANGEMGPFAGTLELNVPSVDAGVVLFSTRSMEDGRVWEATVVRVAFRETSPCGGLPASTTPAPTGVTRRVFFTCDETPDAAPVGLLRSVPADAEPLRAVLDALLDGPSAAERAAGFTSWFSAATSGMVTGVEVSDAGDAVVDFADLRPVIPNASASAGSQLLLDQLDATTFQIETVRSVEYRIAGDCEAFFEWLQLAGCEPRRSS